jgi:glycosyltransferase involved in cell wall biosynthesis
VVELVNLVNPGSRSLTLVHALSPAAFGGLEQVVHMLTRAQVARGHRVHALLSIGPAAEHPLAVRLEGNGVAVHPLRYGGRDYLREQDAMRTLLDQLRPDVVHSHGYRSDILMARPARRLGIPRVSTAHGFTGGGFKARVYEWLQVRNWRTIDRVIAVSHPLVERLTRSGVPVARIRLVPNAWDLSSVPLERDAARRALGLPLDQRIIGWVGRLSHEKGADVMLAALSQLQGGALLAVAGTGPAEDALKAAAHTAGLDARIRWLGPVADAGRHFAAFDCFALSSRTEGTPIALFEAMAARVPVVATKVGGVPHVVGTDDAVLVPSDNPGALAAALDAVFQDPAGAERRAQHAHARLDRDFAIERWQAEHDAIYQEVLRVRPTGHGVAGGEA